MKIDKAAFAGGAVLISALIPATANAMCPVCTAAALAGVGLSRWLKIDDTISGMWVGALTVSASLWTINWLKTKKIDNIFLSIGVFLAYYATVLIPFYKTDIIGHPANVLWGVDKLVLGIVIGSLAFTLGHLGYQIVKENNGGKAHFPFEKIVFALGPIAILNLIFYFITR